MTLEEFYKNRDRFTPHLDCINQEFSLFLVNVFEDLEMYLTLTDRAIIEAGKEKVQEDKAKTLKEISEQLKTNSEKKYDASYGAVYDAKPKVYWLYNDIYKNAKLSIGAAKRG